LGPGRARPSEESLDLLAGFLGEERGFKGNVEDYYNPENSLLHRVLETGLGIPLSLSILYLSVAARLGLPLSGIPLPGHFLVASKKLDRWYDPFEGGKRLEKGGLQEILQRAFGSKTRVTRSMLQPLGKRLMLARLVRNLKQAYASRRDLSSLLSCAELGLLLEPRDPELFKERGLVLYQMGQYQPAMQDLQAYLARAGRRTTEQPGRRHAELLYRVLLAMN
jgi:regulator of sirC expression with transglutaminase-like and TPR domain